MGPGKWHLHPAIMRNGQRYRRKETFNGSLRQAERRYLDLVAALEAEAVAPKNSSSLTFFKDALEFYTARRTIHYNSITYIDVLKRDLGKIRIDELRKPLESYLFQLKTAGRANGTINKYIAHAKAALNFCLSQDMIQENPLKPVKVLRTVPRDADLTPEERKKLLMILKKDYPHLWPIVNYCLQVPCRKSEMVNAKREDYNEFSQIIRIRNGTTKNDSGVWKPVPPDMVEYFKSIPADCPYLFFKKLPIGRQDVIANRGRYRYVPLGDFKRCWGDALTAAGISEFRFHDLRHVAATELVLKGNSERQIMDIAGWKTNMLSTYFHRGGMDSARTVKFGQDGVQLGVHFGGNSRVSAGILPLKQENE